MLLPLSFLFRGTISHTGLIEYYAFDRRYAAISLAIDALLSRDGVVRGYAILSEKTMPNIYILFLMFAFRAIDVSLHAFIAPAGITVEISSRHATLLLSRH